MSANRPADGRDHGEVSVPAAIALLTVVVGVAGLLPAFGSRYVTVGLGLGMASLFGYGLQPTGAASAAQISAAPAVAVGVVAVLRLLLGLPDPHRPTRQALAEVLESDGTEPARQAVRLWFSDRRERWAAEVLRGALSYAPRSPCCPTVALCWAKGPPTTSTRRSRRPGRRPRSRPKRSAGPRPARTCRRSGRRSRRPPAHRRRPSVPGRRGDRRPAAHRGGGGPR